MAAAQHPLKIPRDADAAARLQALVPDSEIHPAWIAAMNIRDELNEPTAQRIQDEILTRIGQAIHDGQDPPRPNTVADTLVAEMQAYTDQVHAENIRKQAGREGVDD